jgi:hypothetical protein
MEIGSSLAYGSDYPVIKRNKKINIKKSDQLVPPIADLKSEHQIRSHLYLG